MLLFFRCTTNYYAKKFISTGNIRFATPSEWIKAYKNGSDGRGDLLEGTFLATNNSLKKELINLKEIEVVNKGNLHYLRRYSSLGLRAFCLYGLKMSDLTVKCRAANKKKANSGKIDKEYFCSFFPEVTKESYDLLPENDKPVVIMITNPKLFLDRVISCLVSIGFDIKEILFDNVRYVDKNVQHQIFCTPPFELFYKDNSFNNQNEFRIIINSQSGKALNILNKNNGIINVGKLDDIAQVYDYYFDDLDMIVCEDRMEFKLPKSQTYTLTNPIEMMWLVHQRLRDEMPNSTKEKDDEDVDWFLKQLKTQHGITFNWKTLQFYNSNNEMIFDASDVTNTLCDHADYFVKEKEYDNAIDSYQRALHLKPYDENIIIKLVELNINLGNYQASIDVLSNWLESNEKNGKMLYYRSMSYYHLSNYDKSLIDINNALSIEPNNDKYLLLKNEIKAKIVEE
jgi:tetratricopeptide (TPR) repeat protein